MLSYFKFSSKRNDKFVPLVKLTDPSKLTYKLVQYLKIRWFSLTKCVNWIKNVQCTVVMVGVHYFFNGCINSIQVVVFSKVTI